MLRSMQALWLFVVLLSTLPVRAQDDDSDAIPDSTGDVSIEVLTFAYPANQPVESLAADREVNASGQSIQATGTGHYVELPNNVRKLSGAHARLQANTQTKPISFSAWQQGLSDQRYVSIQGEGIRGRMLLKPGKPLSVSLELQFTSAAGPMVIRQTRPAHFGETLYFDHPAFGALIRIDQAAAQ